MVFNSAIFLFAFFPLVFLLSRLIPSTRGREVLLCAASVVFYAFGKLSYVLLLLFSAVFNYWMGRLLARPVPRRMKRPNELRGKLCALGVAVNLALLGVFKYLGFFIGTLNSLTGLSLPVPAIALPVGISFFTFQAIAYLVDVYRAPEQAAERFGSLLLYLSFFPRLLAGPLVHYADAAGQMESLSFAPEATAQGLRRFVRGLAKKLLLADILGSIANTVFALEASSMTAALAWLGAVSYMLQLYFDFSGYSDMSIGLGRVFGFRFPENFNYPYIATSLTEFWRRWHITLSQWFRDYVYIPLGGNRRGARRTAINKLCVFICTGLWHGAGWTFVLWGLWHGAFMMLESAAKPLFDKLRAQRLGRAALHVYTLLLVLIGFVLFRASSLGEAWTVLSHLFGFGVSAAGRVEAAALLRSTMDGTHTLALVLGAVLATPVLPRLQKRLPEGAAQELGLDVLALAVFFLCLLAMSGSGFTPFIYFQF